MKYLYTLYVLLVIGFCCISCNDNNEFELKSKLKTHLHLNIATKLGGDSRVTNLKGYLSNRGDHHISVLEVYLLKANKRNQDLYEPIATNPYVFEFNSSKSVVEIEEKLEVGTYTVLVLANTRDNSSFIIHSEDGTSVGFNSYVSYPRASYFLSSPEPGQFPMSSANSYVGETEKLFYEQYKFEVTEEPIEQQIDIDIQLDRLFACVDVMNKEPINTTHIEVEDGLSLEYRDFAVFNLHLQDYLFKHLKKYGLGDTSIQKVDQKSDVKAYEWSYFYGKEWDTIKDCFTPHLKILPEFSPYYRNKEERPTQGEATGALIRVVGKKNGTETTIYAKREDDKYLLTSIHPINGEFTEYPNGMFYTLYIRDSNLPLQSGKPHYTVVRNTAYYLTIKSLSKPGGVSPFEDLYIPNPNYKIKDEMVGLDLLIEPWYQEDLIFN